VSLETSGRRSRARTARLRERVDRRGGTLKLRAEIGEGLGRQAARSGVLKPPPPAVEEFSPHAVVSRAVARVQETKSTFSRSDLTRAVEAELPGVPRVWARRAR
jgi:hypothetical protein